MRRRDIGETFIQAAGSANGMTIEVSQLGEDGNAHLYTVGKPQPAGDTTVLVPINRERAVRVFENEIFTADEAAEIFDFFHGADRVPDSFTLSACAMSLTASAASSSDEVSSPYAVAYASDAFSVLKPLAR